MLSMALQDLPHLAAHPVQVQGPAVPAVLAVHKPPTQMEEHISTGSEFEVLLVARSLSPMLPLLSPDCLELLIPLVTSLPQSPHTAVFSSWLLLDKISSTLGADKTKEFLVFFDPVTFLYLISSPTAKHAKLYHRSFLMTLIVRFKQKIVYQILS